MWQSIWKPLLVMLVLVLAFNFIYTYITGTDGSKVADITYSRFKEELARDNIGKINIKGSAITSPRVRSRAVQGRTWPIRMAWAAKSSNR